MISDYYIHGISDLLRQTEEPTTFFVTVQTDSLAQINFAHIINALENEGFTITPLTTSQTYFRVMWVGNSHTATGEIPRQVREILMHNGIIKRTTQITSGGTTLSDHAENVIELLQENSYDFVILQDWGGRCCSYPGNFAYDVWRISTAAHESGATPVLYNPAFRYDDWPVMDSQHWMTAQHRWQALQNHTLFVDAPMAWLHVLEHHPELELFQPTGTHANPRGAFVTSAVFVSYLFGIEVNEVPSMAVYDSPYVAELGRLVWEFANK
jgi:hypothetical protein